MITMPATVIVLAVRACLSIIDSVGQVIADCAAHHKHQLRVVGEVRRNGCARPKPLSANAYGQNNLAAGSRCGHMFVAPV